MIPRLWTFVLLLSAPAHSGLLDYFDDMALDSFDDPGFNDTLGVPNGLTSRPVEKIAETILKKYVRSALPNEHKPTEVKAHASYVHLVKVQENQRIISVSLGMIFEWYDPRLTWNASQHSNVTQLTVPEDTIWLPPLAFYNAVQQKWLWYEKARLVRIYNTGKVEWNVYNSITSICWLWWVEYFPFDSQYCTLSATTPYLNTSEVVVTAGISTDRVGNDEFDVIDIEVLVDQLTDLEGENRTDMFVKITMKRHPMYYITVLVIPTALLALIATAGFFSTNIADCIMNIGLTALLTSAMVLAITASIVPKAKMLHLLGYYITITICVLALSVMVGLVVSLIENNCAPRGKSWKPPRVLRCFFGTDRDKPEKCGADYRKQRLPEDDSNLFFAMVRQMVIVSQARVDRKKSKIRMMILEDEWRALFRRFRLLLLVIFELVHISGLCYFMSFWLRDNTAPDINDPVYMEML